MLTGSCIPDLESLKMVWIGKDLSFPPVLGILCDLWSCCWMSVLSFGTVLPVTTPNTSVAFFPVPLIIPLHTHYRNVWWRTCSSWTFWPQLLYGSLFVFCCYFLLFIGDGSWTHGLMHTECTKCHWVTHVARIVLFIHWGVCVCAGSSCLHFPCTRSTSHHVSLSIEALGTQLSSSCLQSQLLEQSALPSPCCYFLRLMDALLTLSVYWWALQRHSHFCVVFSSGPFP